MKRGGGYLWEDVCRLDDVEEFLSSLCGLEVWSCVSKMEQNQGRRYDDFAGSRGGGVERAWQGRET